MRRLYAGTRMLEDAVAAEPFAQFHRWLGDAVAAGLPEPNAMVLATVHADGAPGARHVLLKELDDDGFVFFTNHGSTKAADIATNPAVALCFPWFPMGRQVSVQGEAARISVEESRAYWARRPLESQRGAWASRQSEVVESRDSLERRLSDVEGRFGEQVPLPEFWGGYRVYPDVVEFWQGAPARLHDRLRYRRTADGWHLQRLAP